MKIDLGLFMIFLLLNSCHQPQQTEQVMPKGELVFLLQYNNRLPSEVGFLTNHIMERRLANLMKENYEPFIKEPKEENPLFVDTIHDVVIANYVKYKTGEEMVERVTVDVANDAIWVDYIKPGTVLHYADRTSLHKPEIVNK